ncbi:tetratricopeptide repeat protein [Luteolibacter arcticus]|uniref:Tetratricopeptide repeat protein n=1 Tax=Luteolibacter arcticus TaxID=1581411 RepID=A0ABT3GT06_9BACT|nr:tetratricopeptide repeat protein [Luteolibacter arcticus]MCW1926650.1 tetratricopeptide repeat protein [Luteolibacter arcticus]
MISKELGPTETIRMFESKSLDALSSFQSFEYADALRRVGRCKEALAIYQSLEGADVPAKHKWLIPLYKGKTLQEMGRFAESEQALIEACRLDDSTVPRVYLAGTLASQERFHEAIEVLQDGLNREGDRDEVLLNLAFSQRTLGRLKEAKESLELALTVTPSYPEALALLEDVNAAILFEPS